MHRIRTLSLIAVMLACAVPARADGVVIAPPKRGPLIADEIEERIVEAITQYLNDVKKLRVTGPVVASAAVPDVEGCFTTACALRYREAFHADYVVQVSIFEREGKPSSFSIALSEREDVQYRGTALINSANLEDAARSAVKEALSKQERGQGPWLLVQTDLKNARVEVDDLALGETPLPPKRVEPGDRVITVKAPGCESWSQTMVFPDGADVERVVKPECVPLQSGVNGGPKETASPRNQDMWKNHALGAALVVTGVAVGATRTVRNLLVLGDCTDSTCQHEKRWDNRNYIHIGLGAAIVAAGSWLAWGYQPFSAEVSVGESQASLTVGGSY